LFDDAEMRDHIMPPMSPTAASWAERNYARRAVLLWTVLRRAINARVQQLTLVEV